MTCQHAVACRMCQDSRFYRVTFSNGLVSVFSDVSMTDVAREADRVAFRIHLEVVKIEAGLG